MKKIIPFVAFALLFVVSAFATGLSVKPSGNEERTVLLAVNDAVVSSVSFEATPVYQLELIFLVPVAPDNKFSIDALVVKNSELAKITPVNLPLHQRIRWESEELIYNLLDQKTNRPDLSPPSYSKHRRTRTDKNSLTLYNTFYTEIIFNPDKIPRNC